MNHTATHKGFLRRAYDWLGHGVFALVVLVAVLLAVFKLAIILLVQPTAERAVQRVAAKLSEQLGLAVEIGFTEFNLSLGYRGLLAQVTAPYITIGKHQLDATVATLAVYSTGLPTLHIKNAHLVVTQHADGSLALGEFALTSSSDLLPLEQLIPANIIFFDTQLTFITANGQTHNFASVYLGVHPDAATGEIHISFTSLGLLRARVNYQPLSGNAEVYLQVHNLTRFMPLLGNNWGSNLRTDKAGFQAWLNYTDGRVSGIAYATAASLEVPLDFITNDNYPAQTRYAALQQLDILVTLTEPVVPTLDALGSFDWRLRVGNVTLNLGEPMLGKHLTLDQAVASGNVRRDLTGWNVRVDDARFTGPLGSGNLSAIIKPAGAPSPRYDIRGSMPMVVYSELASLLPAALSDGGVPFLRNDVQTSQAQATTLVISGDDFGKFPWHNNRDGQFLLAMDFFGGTLNYTNGHPLLTGGDGSFALAAQGLALTIANAQVGPMQLGIARVGVDDLTATYSTLYVATDAILPDGALFQLLNQLPETAAATQTQLSNLHLIGAQHLSLAVTVPLDTDDPIKLDGRLEPVASNAISYAPLNLTLSNFTGGLDFNRNDIHGIAYGELLGAGVRITVDYANEATRIGIDGSFDLAAALHEFGLTTDIPLHGRSAVAAVISDDTMVLRSNLVGTAINLPEPFGKQRATSQPLVVAVNKAGLRLNYGDSFLRAVLQPNGATALAFNATHFPTARTIPGTSVSGKLADLDLDKLLSNISGTAVPLAQPTELELVLTNSTLLGFAHPQLSIRATLATTLTLASIAGDAIAGDIEFGANDALQVSLSHLHIPADDHAPDKLATDATIFIKPGILTPTLPALDLTINDLRYGKQSYHALQVRGQPAGDIWRLELLRTNTLGDSSIQASGTTNISGEPHTELTLAMQTQALGEFIGNYFDADSISGGAGTIGGTLTWRGSLLEPHYLSMHGKLNIDTTNFVLNKESGGVKLLNLLSPFTIFKSLTTPLQENGIAFASGQGQAVFTDGQLHLKPLNFQGDDVNIDLSGNTNLITRRNNIKGIVTVNKTADVATTAIGVVNPAAGAFLWLLKNTLGVELIGPATLNYTITGTWDKPIIETNFEHEQHQQKAAHNDTNQQHDDN